MGFLSKGLVAVLTLERLLTRVSPEVDLDVGLVEETSIAYCTVVNWFVLRALCPNGQLAVFRHSASVLTSTLAKINTFGQK